MIEIYLEVALILSSEHKVDKKIHNKNSYNTDGFRIFMPVYFKKTFLFLGANLYFS